ncbi:hypothetical protein [Rhodococcus opacus]
MGELIREGLAARGDEVTLDSGADWWARAAIAHSWWANPTEYGVA